MTSRRLLTVDLSNQIYRACHAHNMLQSVSGKFTGGLFGFLQSVSKAIEVSGATDILVCRDMKPYLRSETYPQYKQLRKKTADPELRAMHDETAPLLDELFDSIGVPCWGIKGFECDDLIAASAIRLRHRFERVVAMTNDSDTFQLFDLPGFRVYKRAEVPLVDQAAFYKAYGGITTEQFILSSALQGTHNDIEGIPGVGPVTALKIIKDPVLLRAKRAQFGELIDRNIALIRLPHPAMPSVPVPFRDRGLRLNLNPLYGLCSRYDIKVVPAWVRALEQVLQAER